MIYKLLNFHLIVFGYLIAFFAVHCLPSGIKSAARMAAKFGSNAEMNNDRRWKKAVVPYVFTDDSLYSEQQLATIRRIMDYIESKSCVKFVPKSEQDIDYVEISEPGNECSSEIGRIGGKQLMHYTAYSFAVDLSKPTISPKSNSIHEKNIGKAKMNGILSDFDIKKLNSYYNYKKISIINSKTDRMHKEGEEEKFIIAPQISHKPDHSTNAAD
ncbi:hypothetical protein B4U80_06729 [Leptotrombidium deliense]|uniref:Peptidase M12A domain-containing protein n=1 Tax=Leptotrombidium deliense TaxID=299467 RepID=A0A443SS37_9ACAR|nr:hypothetical protein B4U80_06729 [Leptotrombidium deliense]